MASPPPPRAHDPDAPGFDYAALIGLHTRGPLAVAERVRAGLGYRSFEVFRRHAALTAERLAALVRIPPRTLARRRTAGRLDPDESDRLVRLARVFAQALGLFEGNEEVARRWLATPLAALGNEPPLRAATTDPGAREVEALIGRLEHGIPA
jgi:putative toxin-antitoxin system antitoxin component (TIGR02293 family)